MKLVGEAVRGTSFGSQIVTIGVTTWGIIKNREQLTAVSLGRKQGGTTYPPVFAIVICEGMILAIYV